MSSSYPYPTVQIAVSHNTGWRKVRPDLCQMDAGGTNTNVCKHHDLAYFAYFTNIMSCFTNRKRSSMTLCIACMLRSIPSRTCMLKPGHCLHSHTPRIMERPQAKRRRENETLKSLLADKSISLQSLERFLLKLRKGDTPTGTRYQLRSAYKERLEHVVVTEALLDSKGNPVNWDFCCPSKLLQYMVDVCPPLEEIYAQAANENRGEWKCVVTFDEFVPGDKLKSNNHRKAMTLCFSFLELGRRALVMPVCWMFPVVVRAVLYNSVDGGFSNFLKIFLRRMFFGANGLLTAGVPLELFGAPFLLKASLSNLLSDGDGLRAALCWKGANSLRPCMRHWNVTKKGTAILDHDGSAELVDVTCSDFNAFKRQSDEDCKANIALVVAAARRRGAAGLTNTMFDTICTSRGLSYHEKGIVFDPVVGELIKQDVITIDWVHTVLCDGTFSVECRLLLERSQEKLAKGFPCVAAFLQGWSFPMDKHMKMKVLHQVFDDFRHGYCETHDKLKANASELLSVYGLVRHWVAVELSGEPSMANEVASFNLCCEVIDIMLFTKRGKMAMATGSRLLKEAHQRSLENHKLCYGTEHVKPKHHWPFDVADQWGEHEYVLDAFLVEKAHLNAKSIADRTLNTSQFERSVLAGVLNYQVGSLLQLGPQQQLLGKSSPFPGFPDSRVADNLCIDGVTVSVGDFAYLGVKVGRVAACVSEGDDFFLVVDALGLVTRIADHSGTYAFDNRRLVWDARNAQLALAWREVAPACFTVIFF